MRWKGFLLKGWMWGMNFLLMSPTNLAQSGGGGSTQPGPYQATPQRPTFTADTSTTAPGTLELEMGMGSSGRFFSLPTSIKFTPDAGRGLFHRMEFSLHFDAISSVSEDDERETHFSDRLGLVIRRPVYLGESFSLAVAPRASFFLRGDRGARLGLTALTAYEFGLNSVVANMTWTSATTPSPTNPAQRYDVAFDFIRQLGPSGTMSRLSVFGGLLTENPTHQATSVSLGQGISYRVRPHWALDFAVREFGLTAGRRDYRIVAGFTINLGRLRDW